MQFTCLDETFQNPAFIKPVNVQWNAKFYECGQFFIEIPSAQYETRLHYVSCKERKQTGIIQKVYQEDKISGKFTQISGFFLERILHDYIIHDTFTTSSNVCEACASIVRKYCTRDDITIKDWGSLGGVINKQITGTEVDTALYEMLRTQNLSFCLYYEYEEDRIYLEFVKGTDRTQSQSANAHVTFSEMHKNISDVTYTGDESNYKNYAFVAGEGQAGERIVESVDISSPGERIREMWVDARDLQMGDGVTITDYRAQLRQRGVESLLDFTNIVNVSFSVCTSLLTYPDDYNLGDRVDCVIDNLELSYETDISEVNEVWKDNQHTIEVVLGDKIPTKYENLRKGQ